MRNLLRCIWPLLCILCLALPAGAEELREALFAAEPEPIAFRSVQADDPFEPISCGPATLAAALRGRENPQALGSFFQHMGWKLGEEQIEFDTPNRFGYAGILRDGDITRKPWLRVMVGGQERDYEILTFGHLYNACTFLFQKDEGGRWELVDCLPDFGQVTSETNGENTWLVGLCEEFATQEGKVYEWWYNLATRETDITLVREATTIAVSAPEGHYRAYVLSEPYSTSYAYEEQGRQIVDHHVVVPKYASLCEWESGAADVEIIRQVDEYTQVDLYSYDQAGHALRHAGTWTFDSLSPATMRYMNPGFFASGMVQNR